MTVRSSSVPSPPSSTPELRPHTSLAELAALFAKLGTIAFGGPAAHVAMMDDEVVRRRGWLTREQFLDYVGATNLIPGPNSTELAIHIGHARAGWPGLVVAGACFILPAMFIVGAIAAVYVRYGTLPEVVGILYGVKPVVIAIVTQALWSLGRTAIKTPLLAVLALAAGIAVALGAPELGVLGAAALAMAALRVGGRSTLSLLGLSAFPAHAAAIGLTSAAATFSLPSLFFTFAKIGAVLFGSGYVLLAFLRSEFVERLGWLTEQQLLDAIAVGQITPGPLFTTATFVGYVLGGPTGGLVATVGIFLPAFVFVAISGPVVPKIRRSPAAGAALDGVNVASLALMGVVSFQLGRAALVDPLTVLLALGSAIALIRYRVSSAWLIVAGAFVGWLAMTTRS